MSDKKNEKVLFDLDIGGIKQTKRIVSKILKIDKDNQYGQAMTKTFAYGCIKKQKQKTKKTTLIEFNKILDKISHDDKIGHLFVVDIKFYNKNPKTLLFNEVYQPIFEKKNIQKDGAF